MSCSTCVSRCPPRSFPNQGGVCWPCHESCETCAGAGQDSCLTCAPAHFHVTDLAVCLQVCPDGYFESKLIEWKHKFIGCSVYLVPVPCDIHWPSLGRASSMNLSGNSIIKVRESSFPDYDNKTCVPCEANCASCQDRPDYCTSCDHHLVMHENKCYSACPEHTYETEDYK